MGHNCGLAELASALKLRVRFLQKAMVLVSIPCAGWCRSCRQPPGLRTRGAAPAGWHVCQHTQRPRAACVRETFIIDTQPTAHGAAFDRQVVSACTGDVEPGPAAAAAAMCTCKRYQCPRLCSSNCQRQKMPWAVEKRYRRRGRGSQHAPHVMAVGDLGEAAHRVYGG